MWFLIKQEDSYSADQIGGYEWMLTLDLEEIYNGEIRKEEEKGAIPKGKKDQLMRTRQEIDSRSSSVSVAGEVDLKSHWKCTIY